LRIESQVLTRRTPAFAVYFPCGGFDFRQTVKEQRTLKSLRHRNDNQELKREEKMIRLIAVAAFALALATSVQAMPVAPLHQPDGMITQVRHNCGAGMRWNEALGRCATTSARRHVRRGVVTGH
jgi:hypothetical protein